MGILKKISTATKTNFTKKYVSDFTPLSISANQKSAPTNCRYNSSEHPIPFHKAHEFGKVPKKLAGGPAPDIEDAFEVRRRLRTTVLFHF